jgi:hypothetical protein
VTEIARELGATSPRWDGLPLDALRYAELPEDRRRILLHVSELLDAIDYGTVVLVMHDGAVVQVEASEKIRL